ncbi:MAG: iron-containing alcohol dehydrogenase [Clostridia bacterium]|nr:iron-containing alcohol dehydrogenase [Clostridia bacterium]
MMNIDISSYMPTRLICGAGCVRKNADVFKKLGKKAVIVTGASSAVRSGALSDAVRALTDCGTEYFIYDKITQNPFTASCFECAELARSFGAEFVLGIGGGSPMDAAKAVSVYLNNPEFKVPSDIFDKQRGSIKYPVALIGVSAGTGSEVTAVSVLTDSRDGRKKSVRGDDCCAAVSFCDFGYTRSLPHGFTVSTALDAFAHATESYFASTSNHLSELYAREALSLVVPEMEKLKKGIDPDDAARENLYMASIFAGLAINITGTCFPHTMGYTLTEVYQIPHGRACTAFAGAFLERAEKYLPEKSGAYFDACGTPEAELIKLIDDLTDVRINASAEDIKKYYPRWEGKINSFIHSPGGFTADDAAEVFASV